MRKNVVVAASVGTYLEYYDFGVYAFVAPVLASIFFPASSGPAALLLILGGFALSYLVRPIGALIWAPLADKHGRKPILLAVILLMTLSTTAIGLLPTFAQAGIVGPLLLMALRILQGISAGGEFGSAISIVAEFAPANKRGYYLSFINLSVGLSLITSAGLTVLLAKSDPDFLANGGWRIPFLVALPLGLIALYIRFKLDESPYFAELAKLEEVERSPVRTVLRRDWRLLLRGLAFAACTSIAFSTYFNWMPSYLPGLGYGKDTSRSILLVALIVYTLCIVPFGWLSDRVGRKPQMLVAVGLLVITVYPVFLIASAGDPVLAGIVLSVAGVLVAALFTSATPLLSEIFSTDTRSTGFSLGWQFGAAAFSGPTPLVMTSLALASLSLPPLYFIAVSLVALVAVAGVRETSGRALQLTVERPPAELKDQSEVLQEEPSND